MVKIDSPEFHGPEDEEVESGVTVYVDEAAARQAFVEVADFLEECRQPIREALTRFIEESEDAPFEDFEAEVNIDRLSFPSYGDENISLRISATVEAADFPFDLDLYLDILAVRLDGIVGGMTFVDILDRPDTTEEERLLGIIEERLRAASAQLK